jgi:hypothetical protein
MPAQRKEGKRLWGGYLEPEDFDRLDKDGKLRGFSTRTDYLVWFAQNCGRITIQDPRSGSNEVEAD